MTVLAAERAIGSVPGSFVRKTVKGESYLYFQVSGPNGTTRQVYLGRKSPALEAFVDRFREGRDRSAPDREGIRRLCAQLRVGGALTTDTASARVLAAMADIGVFRLGGVLVGTHAFIVLGNILGVAWEGRSLLTYDIDVAGERHLDIALPPIPSVDVPAALDALEMGFLPVPGLDPRSPSTSFKVRGDALRVDLLTPAARAGGKAVSVPRFNAAAQPLPFLDYLIEGAEPAIVVGGDAVLVSVPDPARFALHKLIVAGERPASMESKAAKDVFQAARLSEMLCDERPGDILIAADAIARRGASWSRRLCAGMRRLATVEPVAHDKLLATVPALTQKGSSR